MAVEYDFEAEIGGKKCVILFWLCYLKRSANYFQEDVEYIM